MFEIGPILRMLRRNKVGVALVVIQLAVALAVISNAAFVIAEREQLIARPTGIVENEIFTITVLPTSNVPKAYADVQRDLEAIRTLPGVIDATVINSVPLSGSGSQTIYHATNDKSALDVSINYFQADDHALNTLGLELIAGRFFTSDEMTITKSGTRDSASVVVLTRLAAEQLFGPGIDPIGRYVFTGSAQLEVIGIVDTFMGSWVDFSTEGQSSLLPMFLTDLPLRYLIRTNTDDQEPVRQAVMDKLRALDPNRVLLGIRGLDEVKARSYRSDTTMIRTLTVAITLLVAVTSLGIAGLTTFWVGRRRKQIGTRRALGASRSAILRLLLVENSLLASFGLGLGLILAIGVNQLMVQHYQMSALPVSYLLVTLAMLWLSAALAALAPAWRATQIAPALATRSI